MIYEIPIDSIYPYFVQISTIENVAYQFQFTWNEREERWRLSLLDMQDNLILQNIKIVPWLPMTRRYRISYLFQGDLIGVDIKTNINLPTRNNLGGDFKLYYFTMDELQALNLDKLL